MPENRYSGPQFQSPQEIPEIPSTTEAPSHGKQQPPIMPSSMHRYPYNCMSLSIIVVLHVKINIQSEQDWTKYCHLEQAYTRT